MVNRRNHHAGCDCDDRVRHVEARIDQVEKHFNALLHEREMRYQQQFSSAQLAVLKAETATEKRFEGVNEFRKTLADATLTFIPRAEAEQQTLALSDKIDVIGKRLDLHDGQGGGLRQGWMWLMGILMLLVAIGGIVVDIFRRG